MDFQFFLSVVLGVIAIIYILKTVFNQYTKKQVHTSCNKCGSSTEKTKYGNSN